MLVEFLGIAEVSGGQVQNQEASSRRDLTGGCNDVRYLSSFLFATPTR